MVEVRDRIPLEDILQKFSVWGRYHALTAVWVGIVLAWNNMCYTNYVFITEKVNYRCREYESFIEEFNGTHADYAETESNVCYSNSTTSCTEWVYEDPNSFVAEFDLACEEWKRTLVGSMHSFGYMVGLLVVGPLSDRLGRKPLVVITGVLGGVCGLTRSFTTNYWLYVVLEFLEAAIGDPVSPIYMISLEMVSTDKRVLYNWICAFGYSLGGIIYPFIFKLIPYWRNCLRVIYTPALLFISYVYLIDESTRWLLIKGKKVKAVTVIEKAAKMNNLDLEIDLNKISYDEEKGASFRRVIVQTFKSRPMLTRFIVCSSWWIASTFVNHGLAIHSVSLQGNKYINYALTSLMDIPGKAIFTYILIKYRRKMPLIISFLAAAVLCIAQPFASGLPWLSVTLFMCGKVLSSGYFKTTYIFTSELFPTYTRNSMHALCSSVGRIGSIAAPQMPLLVAYWSGFPPIIFGLVSLVAGVMTFLVPDTSEDPLPDTVDQAETLGKIAESVKRQEPKDGTARF